MASPTVYECPSTAPAAVLSAEAAVAGRRRTILTVNLTPSLATITTLDNPNSRG
jgi:hypothetical protein